MILSLRSVGRVRHRAEQECSDQAAERAREERHQQQKRQIVERRGRAERDERGADLPAVVRRRARDGDAEDAELFRLAEQRHHEKRRQPAEQREQQRRGIPRKQRAERAAHEQDGERARKAEGVERVERDDIRKTQLDARQRHKQHKWEKRFHIGKRQRQRGQHRAERELLGRDLHALTPRSDRSRTPRPRA